VTVTLPRPDRDEAMLPPEGQAVIELTAAAILADGLLTAWTSTKSVVSMVVELPSVADALEAGVAVARALQGGDGVASVTAEPLADQGGVSLAADTGALLSPIRRRAGRRQPCGATTWRCAYAMRSHTKAARPPRRRVVISR